MEELYITTEEASKILGVSRQQMAKYRSLGLLSSVQYKSRGHHHYRKQDIIDFKNGKT